MVSNLFGTKERTRFLFRDTLATVRRLVELKIDPTLALKQAWRYRDVPRTMWRMRPKRVGVGTKNTVLKNATTVDQLPQVTSWPKDGGAFITLPEVYTEDPDRPGFTRSNLGHVPDSTLGRLLCAQSRSRTALSNSPFDRRAPRRRHSSRREAARERVCGRDAGNDARRRHAVAGRTLGTGFCRGLGRSSHSDGDAARWFASLCGGRLLHLRDGRCAKAAPEGPFGDHLGYYSLAHDFPVLDVEAVSHRDGAIWPFTTVGRPPQEDTSFGEIIHEITGPIIPTVIPGVHAVHAVDAAGVHPLLLAIGSERYVPYARQRGPQELLTNANAILGQGQLSLAKYLFIVAHEDDSRLDIHDIPRFFTHVLSRVDWQTDLHFQTQTTIDTLDYSGAGLNAGSKVVIAAAGPPRRELPIVLPAGFTLPDGFGDPRLCLPGIVAVVGPTFSAGGGEREPAIERFCGSVDAHHPLNVFPLVVIVDDSEFTARSLNNFLWTTFTRSNPAADVHGIGEFVREKHWGCRGSLLIDARIKPHHAPPLVEDPEVSKRVDRLGAPGGPLHGII